MDEVDEEVLCDPNTLAPAGRILWDDVTQSNPGLDSMQLVQLLEACRMKDRLDKLDALLRGDVAVWAEIELDRHDHPVSLTVDKALSNANTTVNIMKQVVAALRLPEAKGLSHRAKTNRGVYNKGGSVSSLDRKLGRSG